MKAEYTYQLRTVKGRSFIMIEDKDNGGRSVTNDINGVVMAIASKEKLNPVEHYIIYKDSMGNWDGYSFSTKMFVPVQEQHWLKAAIKFITKYG